MLLKHSCKPVIYYRIFLFLCYITQHYHETFAYILVAVIAVVNVFQLYQVIGLLC